MMLIYILIFCFVSLLLCQIYNSRFHLIEGLENATSNTTETTSVEKQYKPYNLNDPNNALILGQQNAGNIEVLKGRIDDFDGVKNQVDTMQQSINSMQVQIDGLVQQQLDYAQDIAGSTPADITGTGIEDEE